MEANIFFFRIRIYFFSLNPFFSVTQLQLVLRDKKMLDLSRFEGVTGFRLHSVTAVTPSVTPSGASSTRPNRRAGINQAFLGKVDENGVMAVGVEHHLTLWKSPHQQKIILV